MIIGIKCHYKEYKLVENGWKLVEDCYTETDDIFINNIINASQYFCKLGGYMECSYVKNRRYGIICNKIFSMSICKTIKKVYEFHYSESVYVEI